MPHLTINGVTFPGEADSFEEQPQWVGETLGRSSNGAMIESRTARKRRWRVRSVFVQAAEAEQWRRMIEGEGQYWRLGSHAISSKGLGPNSGGSYTYSTFTSGATSGLGAIEVASGSSIKWSLTSTFGSSWSPSSGYTVSVYARKQTGDGDTESANRRYLFTGSSAWTQGTANPSGVTQYRDGASGSYGAGYWIDLTSAGVLGLYGYGDSAGAAGAHRYQYLSILPFAIPSTWVSGLVAHTSTMLTAVSPFIAEFPRVVLAGDAIPDTNGVNAVGRVQVLEQRNVRLGGAHRSNARILDVDFFEV